MVIPIDIDSAGNVHYVEVNESNPKDLDHPDNSGRKCDIVEMLTYHSSNPQAREVGGWHEVNQLEGEDRPYTRWERLLNGIKQLPPDHPLVALHLK